MRVLKSVSQPAEQKASPKITLSPSQRKAADGVFPGLKRGDRAVLQDQGSSGTTTVLCGMSRGMNPATQSMHIDYSMMTMGGFAYMMTQLVSQVGGGPGNVGVAADPGGLESRHAVIDQLIVDHVEKTPAEN
jgi:hypothetical protein